MGGQNNLGGKDRGLIYECEGGLWYIEMGECAVVIRGRASQRNTRVKIDKGEDPPY